MQVFQRLAFFMASAKKWTAIYLSEYRLYYKESLFSTGLA